MGAFKIDGKVFVPIGWVLGSFGVVISTTVMGALWVATVNFRLQRIEEKLGIPQFKAAGPNVVQEAYSKELGNENRLSEPVRKLRSH